MAYYGGSTSCFENIIGLKGLCDTASSNLYINPLVSLKEFEDMITREYLSPKDLFLTIYDHSLNVLINQITEFYNQWYIMRNVIEDTVVGKYTDQPTLETSAIIKGIFFDMQPNSFLDLYVSSISLNAHYTGTVEINVYDFVCNKIVDTISIEAEEDCTVTTYVDKTYKILNQKLSLFFGIDSIPANISQIKQGGCNTCPGSDCWTSKYLKAYGGELMGNVSRGNLKTTNKTGGLSINFSLSCNHRDWLCNKRNLLGLPLLYRVSYEAMEFLLNTPRSNSLVNIDRENTERRKAVYGSEYDQAMKNLFGKINPPSDRTCFNCNSPVQYAITLP